ncbi:hypothetical protein LXA43DRAFT_1063392 [Ganoderma leucocontextum]|nr:hypothetical protein LXA43DRAFT_1063392 [Ganoderma leucocontextum]
MSQTYVGQPIIEGVIPIDITPYRVGLPPPTRRATGSSPSTLRTIRQPPTVRSTPLIPPGFVPPDFGQKKDPATYPTSRFHHDVVMLSAKFQAIEKKVEGYSAYSEAELAASFSVILASSKRGVLDVGAVELPRAVAFTQEARRVALQALRRSSDSLIYAYRPKKSDHSKCAQRARWVARAFEARCSRIWSSRAFVWETEIYFVPQTNTVQELDQGGRQYTPSEDRLKQTLEAYERGSSRLSNAPNYKENGEELVEKWTSQHDHKEIIEIEAGIRCAPAEALHTSRRVGQRQKRWLKLRKGEIHGRGKQKGRASLLSLANAVTGIAAAARTRLREAGEYSAYRGGRSVGSWEEEESAPSARDCTRDVSARDPRPSRAREMHGSGPMPDLT